MLIKKVKIPFMQMILYGLLPGLIKKALYRSRGYKIGKNVKIGIGSIISGKEVLVGDNTKIGHFTIIRGKKIKIGRYVQVGTMTVIDTERIEIDDDARINEQVIIGGIKTPESYIKLGKRTIVMEYSFLNPTKPLIIGDDTGIGGHCLLFTHGSWLSQLEGYPVTFAPITIGKNVWLPWRVFILPGTTIGNNVVIGANSLVSKIVPSNVLIAGSPAKIIKEKFPKPIDDVKKKAILDNIYNEFIEYLSYNGISVESEINQGSISMIATKEGKKHHLFHFEHEPKNFQIHDDAVIIENYIDNDTLSKNSGSTVLLLNLKNKTRKGTSEIGEELVKFLSRYGIRFDRLD